MKKVAIVFGFGPGISDAVARKFGKEGFSVALVARITERLETAQAALTKDGIEAKAFPCDVSNALPSPSSARRSMYR
ncbi:MAG: SDR family NAD(P)-dependent oxidoreductase [Myxococcaceae bacterium]